MAKTATTRACAEPTLEREAEAVLVELDLTLTQAITLVHREIGCQRAAVFPLRLRKPPPKRNV